MSIILSCPWCGQVFGPDAPLGWQFSHLIACGDARIAEAWNNALEAAAKLAEHPNAGMVPPDGGDPTTEERFQNLATSIRALA